jgi:hypothetical protein
MCFFFFFLIILHLTSLQRIHINIGVKFKRSIFGGLITESYHFEISMASMAWDLG